LTKLFVLSKLQGEEQMVRAAMISWSDLEATFEKNGESRKMATNDQIRRMPRPPLTPLALKLTGAINEQEYDRLMAEQREREARARASAATQNRR
jgi:predicted glycosyltransferase